MKKQENPIKGLKSLESNRPKIEVLLLAFIGVFVLGVFLHELRSVLLPFVIAVLFSILFSPLVVNLKKRGIPTAVSLLVVLLTFALFLFLLSLLVYSSADSFVREFPKYEAKFTRILDNGFQIILDAAARMNLTLEDVQWNEAFHLSSLTSALTAGVGSFLNLLNYLFLVLLFMLFILAGSGELEEKLVAAFPPSQAARITKVIRKIESRVRQYLLTKTLISLATGFLTFLVLWILGVDFPLIWGILTFLLNFIPNIGSMIAVAFPVALSFVQFDSIGQAILVLILLMVMQALMGNVLEPELMAFRMNLSALVVLVSLIFWGWLWGVLGMILAVPLMATVKIIFENVGPLQPIAILMGGSPKE